MSPRVLPILLAIVLVALVLTTLATGSAVWMIPAAVLVLLIGGYAVLQRGLRARVDARHDGDVGAAMADSEDPVPSAHVIADEETPLGDTTEAHDEISPHDLPKSHPGRAEAERAADERFRREGERVTKGNR